MSSTDQPEVTQLPRRFAELQLPIEVRDKFKVDPRKPYNIIIVGKYQVGKSTLINSLFYDEDKGFIEYAKEGDMERTTSEIKFYKLKVDDVTFHVYDTIGLQDGNDKEYVKKVIKLSKKAHLVIYCTKLCDPVRPDEKSALKTLTRVCKKSFWDILIVALTHANLVQSSNPGRSLEEYFEKQLEKRRTHLYEFFVNELGIQCVSKSRIIPVGAIASPSLPGIDDWRGDFWVGCMHASAEGAKGAVATLAWKQKVSHEELKKRGKQIIAAGAGVATAGAGVGAGIAGTGLIIAGVGEAISLTVVGLPVGIPLIVAGLIAAAVGRCIAVGGAIVIGGAKKGFKK